jgi:hypothetical protein
MHIYPEIWPVAADELGIWLISGLQGAWRPRLPVMAGSEPHADVEQELTDRGVRSDTTFLHSTSWRVDGGFLIVTYVAIVSRPGLAQDHWADPLLISMNMVDLVGKPRPHSPTGPPAPRHIDVLLHALRHLRFLIRPTGDRTAQAVLAEPWPTHLAQFDAALAGMYSQVHRSIT